MNKEIRNAAYCRILGEENNLIMEQDCFIDDLTKKIEVSNEI